MQQLSNGFVPCLRVPCLLLHHISPPSLQWLPSCLGMNRLRGKEGAGNGCSSREQKNVGISAVRLSPLHVLLRKKEAGLQQLLHCCEQCLSTPFRSVDGVRPCVAWPQMHHSLAWAGSGVGAWLPVLDWKGTDDFSSGELVQSKEKRKGAEREREAKLELILWAFMENKLGQWFGIRFKLTLWFISSTFVADMGNMFKWKSGK